MRSAELKPNLPASLFSARPAKKDESKAKDEPRINISGPRSNEHPRDGGSSHQPIDIDDLLDGMDENDILAAGESTCLNFL